MNGAGLAFVNVGLLCIFSLLYAVFLFANPIAQGWSSLIPLATMTALAAVFLLCGWLALKGMRWPLFLAWLFTTLLVLVSVLAGEENYGVEALVYGAPLFWLCYGTVKAGLALSRPARGSGM